MENHPLVTGATCEGTAGKLQMLLTYNRDIREHVYARDALTEARLLLLSLGMQLDAVRVELANAQALAHNTEAQLSVALREMAILRDRMESHWLNTEPACAGKCSNPLDCGSCYVNTEEAYCDVKT